LQHLPRVQLAIWASVARGWPGSIRTDDAGLLVPYDISVVGFNDIELVQYVYPSLTVMRHPVDEMIREALRLMLELIDGDNTSLSEMVIRIPPVLVVRQFAVPAASG
jgi:DNA-binding LacI/PurR family transcriptional regulator